MSVPCVRSVMTNKHSFGHRLRSQDEAYLLHRRPYRDSSLIADLLTREHGRVGLVCRAARQPRSAQYVVNQHFCRLQIVWQGRGELGSLRSADAATTPQLLTGDSLFSGLYINELLMRLLHRHDPCPDVFDLYVETLAELPQAMMTGRLALHRCLRRFELQLLTLIGYRPLLTQDIENGLAIVAEAEYIYLPLQGPLLADKPHSSSLVVPGQVLLQLAADDLRDEQSARIARNLMRRIILACLDGKPLRSWCLFSRRAELAAHVQIDD